MKKICLQAGHQNAKNNCDPKLAKGTGAPGEVEFTIKTRDRLSQILLSKKMPDGSDAFTIQLVDATFNCDPKANDQDYDLFLAIHYDADVYKDPRDGGFLDFPEPSTDGATQESQRIVREMEAEYFNHAGIRNMPNRRNANTKFYYMWKFLSAKTPCVIIECGVGKDPHDSVILADTDRVCNAIARGICRAFGVPWETTPPTPTPEPTPTPDPDCEKQVAGLKARNTDLTNQLAEATAQVKNREEQVSRLKTEVTDEQKLRKDATDALNKALVANKEVVGVYEGQLKAKQGLIDELAKAKGDQAIEIAQLKAKLANVLQDAVKHMTAGELFGLFLKKLVPTIGKKA